jgi:hypothetical protein
MTTYRKIVSASKVTAHAAVLLFGAFWLVATSNQTGPAQDCFTGITNPTTLSVVLGTPQGADGGAQGGFPSCDGIDGLTPGATIILTLSQGPRPQAVEPACWNYQTQAIQGLTDVTVTLPGLSAASQNLTDDIGLYSSTQTPGCQGSWTFSLGPASPPTDGHLVSPLDAHVNGTPSQNWIVSRTIVVDQAQSCSAPLMATASSGCDDSFPVASITQVTP